MADDKKAAPAPKKADWLDMAGWLLLVIFAVTIFRKVYEWYEDSFGSQDVYTTLGEQLFGFSTFSTFPIFTIFSWFISFVLLWVCMYLLMRVGAVMEKLKARNDPPATEDIKFREPIEVKTKQNERWEEIQNLIRSNSESMWRLAILEADIMLGEMLDVLGYEGEDIGERLKSAAYGDFSTLNMAWEAHKVRNRIAHEGSQFPLTHEDANRVIKLYEEVFQEFSFI